MMTSQTLYAQRRSEAEKYIGFVVKVLEAEAVANPVWMSVAQQVGGDGDVLRILKANAFLILYNLIEATTKGAMLAVHDAIRQERINYQLASDSLRAEYVQSTFKHLLKSGGHHGSYVKVGIKLASDVVTGQTINFEASHLPISGNLDVRKLREIAKSYGMQTAWPSITTNTAEDVLSVKGQRNDLAHGLISFTECGRDFTAEDLVRMSSSTIICMDAFLAEVTRYVSAKQFQAT